MTLEYVLDCTWKEIGKNMSFEIIAKIPTKETLLSMYKLVKQYELILLEFW